MLRPDQSLTPRQERYLARLAVSKERLLAVLANLDEPTIGGISTSMSA